MCSWLATLKHREVHDTQCRRKMKRRIHFLGRICTACSTCEFHPLEAFRRLIACEMSPARHVNMRTQFSKSHKRLCNQPNSSNRKRWSVSLLGACHFSCASQHYSAQLRGRPRRISACKVGYKHARNMIIPSSMRRLQTCAVAGHSSSRRRSQAVDVDVANGDSPSPSWHQKLYD